MPCAIIVFLLPIFALISRVADTNKSIGKKIVQLSIEIFNSSAGKNLHALNTNAKAVEVLLRKNTVQLTNALDLPFSLPWPHYKLHLNVKQKSTCCVLAQQRWQKKMTTDLINLNTETKVSCKLRKLILFVKQPENDYKQLAKRRAKKLGHRQ